MMRSVITFILLMGTATIAIAYDDRGPPVVICEASKWDGSATSLSDGRSGKTAKLEEDWTHYPERVYFFSPDNKTALVRQGRFKWDATVVASTSFSRTVSFSIAGEPYMDLIEHTGTVITTYLRFRLRGMSSAQAFTRKCSPQSG